MRASSMLELEEKARNILNYIALRGAFPLVPAAKVWGFVKSDEEGSLSQFICRHDWAVSEEDDRCYCLNCGKDGDA